MILESSVANVLRDKPVGRINFKVEGIAINKERMESAAKAVENQGHFGRHREHRPATGRCVFVVRIAEVGRRREEADRKMTLGSADVVKTSLGKAAIARCQPEMD
jgi:hypothetical protein